jgi:oligopeptide/dipeptide ABC transporter ATP-binding protein
MTALLEVSNLEVAYQTRRRNWHAVRDVSFSLYPGETVGIVGESGCGKSLTAKALLKLLPSDAWDVKGQVCYLGQNLFELSEKKMQSIRGKEMGMIFQDPMTSLNPTMKIGAQIVEGYLRHHPEVSRKQAEAYAIEMLERVQIPNAKERAMQYPFTLSGGMRQRVMIALALASKPKILIADEPTTALDVTIQAQILHLMKDIQQQMGMSILLITHDLSVVAGFCDRVLVMYAGKIVESAPVQELFANPQHPYTQRLLQAIPRLDHSTEATLSPIEGRPPELHQMPKGCAFCERCTVSMPICSENPPLINVTPTHKTACWKYSL